MEATILGRSKSDFIKLLITILLPSSILLIPTNEVFTGYMRLFFVFTLIAILAFALETLNQTAVALALPLSYIISGIAPGPVVFSPWLNYIPWMMIGGLLLASVLEKIGLLRRVAYACILATGASYKGILWGLMFAGIILNLAMPGQAVIPLATLSYGICIALGLKKGPATAGITLAAAMASLLPMMFIYNSNILLVMGIGEPATGKLPLAWVDVVIQNLPMILYPIIMTFLTTIVFKPEQTIQGKEYFQGELDKLGKISKDEWKGLFITLFLFAFLLTGNGVLHNIEVAWGFAIIPLLFYVPGIDLGDQGDIKDLNWGFIFFITACLGIGNAAGHLGIGKIISQMALPILEGRSPIIFFLFVWVLFFLMNFLLTPLALMAAFTLPLAEIAVSLNINPMTVYYVLLNGCDQIIFPYEYALYLIFFSFGMVRMGDFSKIMGIKVIVNFAIVFALLIPYWNMIGFIQG